VSERLPAERNLPAGTLTLLLFGLAAAVCIAAVLAEPAGLYDEGLIVSGAASILRGQHPYVDFNSGYPPGQFYTLALVFRLFGQSLLAARLWDTVWRLATVAAALGLAREFAGKRLRLLPLACCAALAGALGFRLYPMVSATLPCLCAVACALAFDRTRRAPWIFASGLLLGATALYRHDLAVCASAVILVSVWRDRRAVAWLAGGTLLVAGPAIAYLMLTVPHLWLRRAFLEFPVMNAPARRLPLPSAPFPLLRDLLLPVAIAAYTALDACRAPAGRRKPLFMLAALAALTLLLGLQRLDTIHIFPSLIFCAVILSAWPVSPAPRGILLAAALLLYGVLPAVEWTMHLQTIRRSPVTGIAAAGPVRLASDQVQALRYIHDHLPPGGALYVGTTSHSRISVNDALFNFLAARPQLTRYGMWLPGETNAPSVQSEIVAALDRAAAPYVVLFDVPPSIEPNLSSVDNGVSIVDDYLHRVYRPEATFARYRILRRVP
jgi:hypothetical protein